LSGHELARLLLVYSKLGYSAPEHMLHQLLLLTLPLLPNMSRGELVSCIHALGKLRC
jgi:hypothetical protein